MIYKTLENTTDFDYLLYLLIEDINANEYFTQNKILKLKDKLTHEVGELLDVVIKKLKSV